MTKKKSAKSSAKSGPDGRSELVSMTGFGKAQSHSNALSLEVELKSVNHRFLDLSFKMPRIYGQFEIELRELIASKVGRGRLEVYVLRTLKGGQALEPTFNAALFEAYRRTYQSLLKSRGKVSAEAEERIVFDLLNRREILEFGDDVIDENKERLLLREAVQQALNALQKMRRAEGQQLANDLLSRLKRMGELSHEIRAALAKSPGRLKERLLARVKKISPEVQIDPQRFAQELAFLADRADVTEELVRLESHLGQFRDTIGAGSNGRKLDFILQELMRECNTIASKTQDAEVQALVVEAKVEVEKLKEQVQNIE